MKMNYNMDNRENSEPLAASEKVYIYLREQIVNGLIEASTPLKQDLIAAKHNISKIPVREALRRLEVEGLVEFLPRRGAIVKQINSTDVLEMLDIRLALECRALEMAIPNMVDSDIELALEIHQQYEIETIPENWSNLNKRFHQCLLAPCGNRHLLSLLLGVEERMGMLVHMRVTQASGLTRPIKEHSLILDACKKCNVELAVSLLRLHIETTQKEVTAFFRRKSLKNIS